MAALLNKLCINQAKREVVGGNEISFPCKKKIRFFNRFEALYRKPSLSITFNTSSKIKKYFCALTFYQTT